jgi:hypothetical protein
MTEAEWLACYDPDALLLFAYFDADKPTSERQNRLMACAFARRVWHLLSDPRSRRAVEVAEAYVDG